MSMTVNKSDASAVPVLPLCVFSQFTFLSATDDCLQCVPCACLYAVECMCLILYLHIRSTCTVHIYLYTYMCVYTCMRYVSLCVVSLHC